MLSLKISYGEWSIKIVIIIHQIFSFARDWFKRVKVLNIPQLKLGNRVCCEKYLKDNKHNSLPLARKCARIFVLKAHSFPRATLSENCFSEQIVSADKYFRAKYRLLFIYYPTLLRRVQISRETSTNITRYLYSSHSSRPREVQNLGKSEFWEKKSLDNKSLIRRFGV